MKHKKRGFKFHVPVPGTPEHLEALESAAATRFLGRRQIAVGIYRTAAISQIWMILEGFDLSWPAAYSSHEQATAEFERLLREGPEILGSSDHELISAFLKTLIASSDSKPQIISPGEQLKIISKVRAVLAGEPGTTEATIIDL